MLYRLSYCGTFSKEHRRGETRLPEARERLLVDPGPLRLDGDLSVPREAVPLEDSQDLVLGARDDARPVEVFHPHEPLAAGAPCRQPRPDGRHEAPEMERPGGRRSEASSCCHGAFLPPSAPLGPGGEISAARTRFAPSVRSVA